VKSIGEYASTPTPNSVESSGKAHEHALHAARQRALVVGLHEEVDVIRLHRELCQAESEAIAPSCEGRCDRGARDSLAQVRKPFAQADGDVERLAIGEFRPRTMSDGLARSRTLPPGSAACSAPRTERELMLSRRARVAARDAASRRRIVHASGPRI
jgi:hypothetical protein